MKEDVEKMLSVKANKVLIQQHVKDATGQTVILKDLHNLDRARRPPGQSSVEDLVETMKKEPGMILNMYINTSIYNGTSCL